LLNNPNTNKFSTWTRWGRVGESGANALLGNGTLADAVKHFEKKFKDKSGLRWEDRANEPKPGKYAFIERSYEPDSDGEPEDAEPAKDTNAVKKEEPEPECTLDEPVRNLMEMIFNQAFFQATMAELNYDANKLPLGKLSKATILRGFEQLKSLSALFDDATLAQTKYSTSLPSATEHLSNTYYSLIPHDFGRHRPPIIRDQSTLKREVELLESLSDMKIAADLMKADRKTDTVHHLDRKFQSLNLDEMAPLKRTTKEFKTLEKYLAGTVGTTHGYKYTVIDIFRIERQGERARFQNSSFANVASDRRLLWHGSRCTNFGGILSQGLRIAPPEAPVSGYMFGKGIYLADMSSKSAGYCCSGMSNGEGLLLLCDAELGNPMQELTHASYDAGETAKKGGMYSTKGLGNTAPQKWMDAGTVHKNLKGVSMVSWSLFLTC
jgi:poly [ADP-ribose] polymerase